MAYKGTGSSFNEDWNATTQGKPDIFIEEWLKPAMTEIFLEESPFAKELNKAGTVASLAPSWQTRQGYPERLTATMASGDGLTGTVVFSGTFNGAAITAELLAQVLRKGSVLQKIENGTIVQAKITQAAPIASLTATIAKHGGTTLTADTAVTEYLIMSPSWADTRGIEQPTSLPRKREHTFTQIFRGEVEVTDTDQNLDEKLVTNPLQQQVEMVLMRMAREKAAAFINGRPVSDGAGGWYTGYDTNEPYMAGLLWWAEYAQTNESNPLIYVDCDNQALTAEMIKELAHQLYLTELAKIERSRYQVWGHPTTMRYKERFQEAFRRTDAKTTKVGFDNNTIDLEGVEVPFKSDRLIPETYVVLAPMADLSYGPFKNGTKRKKVETDDFSEQWMIKEHIYGLLPENPRHIGVLYNVRPYSD